MCSKFRCIIKEIWKDTPKIPWIKDQMMKHTHTQRKLFALTTLALSLCGAVLLTLCYLTAYDCAIGYFKKDAILPILTNAFALLFTARAIRPWRWPIPFGTVWSAPLWA